MAKYPIHVLDTIRPVTPDDYPEVSSWLISRGLRGLLPDLTPPQGLIAPGVAAGFLIRTNTNIGLLESFTSNPKAPKADREQALAKIAKLLIEAGQVSGMVAFMALTSSERVKELCRDNGFILLPGCEVWVRGS